MKSIPLLIESLESRVAPAILVNGGNLLGGAGNPTTGETSSGGNTVTLIKVLSGQALVFYDSSNSEITGISVGKHTKLDITGNLAGDIVTNLLPSGRLTDSDNNPGNGEDGGILLPYTIKGVTTHPLGPQKGDIGRIIAGGSVNNINIGMGSLSGIYAGNGIFRDGSTAIVTVGDIDYNTIFPGVQNSFTLTQASAVPGSRSDIHNVAVHTADQLEIFAGSGADSTTGTGAAGGTITNVTIDLTLTGQGSKPALFLHAGDGGSGTDGGAGGGITNFDDKASIAYVKIQTGNGGDASTGTGGAGGSLEASTIVTSSPRYDLLMGHGGAGVGGGKGGTISTLDFTNNITGGKSLIATGDFNGDGVQDVLLINTVTGEGTLSLGTGDVTTPYTIALQPLTNPDGSTGTTPFIVAEGAVPTSVVAVDLNNDGHLDFVVSYASTNDLGVFLNHGDGTFAASAVALPTSPTRIVTGNFSGSTAPDIAVLSAGDLASVNGGQNSQVFITQGDGAGNLTLLSGAVTITGVATDLAAAQIDGIGGTDLFVGLASGSIDPLFATGTSFNVGAPISAFSVPVDNLDVSTAFGGVTLLAFSKDINSGDPTSTVTAPQVNLISIKADGTANGTVAIMVDPGASKAHFVGGTTVVGVVNNSAVELYENTAGTYTVVSNLGSDGVLSDFSAAVIDNAYQIVAVGAATNRFFYSDGDLNSTAGLPAFQHFNLPYEERIISFVGGDGGDAVTHAGGTGGSIKSLTYTQTLGGGVIEAGGGYNTFVTTGTGGSSTGGVGGRGGDMAKVALSLDPGYVNENQDDTDFAFFRTGNGGDGTTGGRGGNISRTTSNTVFSDVENGGVTFGAVAVQLEAGNGGNASVNGGGAGGNITLEGAASLSGVTFYDIDGSTPESPALLVEAGNGGAGVTSGGGGGVLVDVGAQNAITVDSNVARNELGSANIISGRGGDASRGDAGDGGAIMGLNVSVQRYFFGSPDSFGIADGYLAVNAGAGGNSTNGHGGHGGVVVKSTAASADGDTNLGFGVLVTGGAGGDGTLGGGDGGAVKKLVVNTPSQTDAYGAILAAGNGGDATVSGSGGAGGGIKGISQSKDVNSAITSILGGSGGTSVNNAGGTGGTVKNVDTVGFIGLPSGETGYLGVFDDEIFSPGIDALFAGGHVSQGIFAGRGANGSANGSVHNIVAYQIAAIGAVVDDNGLFGVATAVTNVNAALIGYDVNGGDPVAGYQFPDNETFVSTVPGHVSPATAAPRDGFILAATVSGVTTVDSNRTANFTFNG